MMRYTILSAMLAVLGLATVGCQDHQKELAALQQQYNDLQAKNKDLERGLNQSQAQLEGKDLELGAARKQITDLQSRKPAGATSGGKTVIVAGGGELGPEWEKTATGATATVASDILFPPGKADLHKTGEAKLKEIVATIRKNYPSGVVKVYGYTDSDPVVKTAKLWQDNLDLSANRAMAVTRELTKLGLKADMIETVAMGTNRPLAPNTSAAGKAKNRRVEIVVLK